MFISNFHENLRSRRTVSLAIMRLINGIMCAQLFMICRLIKVPDVLGGGVIS
jgi:hypothetical protein